MPVFTVSSWSPWVYGDVVDFTLSFNETNTIVPAAGFCAIVSKPVDGEVRYWNGSALVTYSDLGMPGSGLQDQPAFAIPATMPTYQNWRIAIPASAIGPGQYRVFIYAANREASGSGVPRYLFGGPYRTVDRPVQGVRSPNPEGVKVDSDFGGTDALRLIGTNNRPIVGALLVATYEDGSERGRATSDAEGRWAFDRVLEPNTVHTIKIEKPKFAEVTTQITTGVAV